MENNNFKRSEKHKDIKKETKEHFTRIQKIIAFIGSILGLITASITIYNFSHINKEDSNKPKELIVEKNIVKDSSSETSLPNSHSAQLKAPNYEKEEKRTSIWKF